ncbi:hypothetical protein Droror1_Dr00019700 [Drosera rotundifolia]
MKMSARPELRAPSEIFYDEGEARKYTSSSCIIEIQSFSSSTLPISGCAEKRLLAISTAARDFATRNLPRIPMAAVVRRRKVVVVAFYCRRKSELDLEGVDSLPKKETAYIKESWDLL